uniref:Nibrin n=1 Tax=Tetraodon nigroviridis TaxID=99883 RepID=H3DLW9_TETNG
MWVLIPLQSEGQTHYLPPGKEYVVGRKNCDVLLTSDQSISRAHAQLVPNNQKTKTRGTTASTQGMTLKDSSKYGTFVNSQRLTGNTAVDLKSGDSVTFGVFESKFIVEHLKPVVCSSCLDPNGKAVLSQSLAALGGELVNSWSLECTHLVMTSVKVTVKTISALLCCVPIVKPEFFSELSRCVQQKLPPPKAERFIPEIDEPSLLKEEINIGVIPGRKTIFTGKTFLFLSAKQLKRLSAAVGFGGGRSLLLEEGSLPRQLLECPQSCLIDVTTGSSQALAPSSTTEWAKAVKNVVQRKGLRVIPESEIGLAAIYASCDRHCNPSHRSVPKVNPRIASASLSQSPAVDETVLPAASQNMTAYAVNTQTQGDRPHVQSWTIGERSQQRRQADRRSSLRPDWKVTASLSEKPSCHSTFLRLCCCAVCASLSSDIDSSLTKLPDKAKAPAQVSPQKQSTLTSFFQPVNKKRSSTRPLQDEPSMSDPKRAALESPVTVRSPNASDSQKTPRNSAAHLCPGQPEGRRDSFSLSAQEELNNRKRKEMEEDIEMDELESIMSLDMDFFDELPAESHQAQTSTQSSHEKKHSVDTAEASSAKHGSTYGEASKRPQTSSSTTHTNTKAFEDDEPEEETKIPMKAVTIKQEVQQAEIDENLPKQLVVVEYRSLTVAEGPKEKPQKVPDASCKKNFKSFRKHSVPGMRGSPDVIAGADLLVHNRGRNSDLDEWLKDAIEEERQSRRDENVGDDLFRYNPTKPSR